MNSANQLLAKDKSLGWAAFDVALSAGIGGLSDWVSPDGVKAVELFMIGLTKDLSLNAAHETVDFSNIEKVEYGS